MKEDRENRGDCLPWVLCCRRDLEGDRPLLVPERPEEVLAREALL